MAFAVWSKYEIGFGQGRNMSCVFKNLAAVYRMEGQE